MITAAIKHTRLPGQTKPPRELDQPITTQADDDEEIISSRSSFNTLTIFTLG
jgi:hypothetical protein